MCPIKELRLILRNGLSFLCVPVLEKANPAASTDEMTSSCDVVLFAVRAVQQSGRNLVVCPSPLTDLTFNLYLILRVLQPYMT